MILRLPDRIAADCVLVQSFGKPLFLCFPTYSIRSMWHIYIYIYPGKERERAFLENVVHQRKMSCEK
jgi:hypothetical protein